MRNFFCFFWVLFRASKCARVSFATGTDALSYEVRLRASWLPLIGSRFVDGTVSQQRHPDSTHTHKFPAKGTASGEDALGNQTHTYPYTHVTQLEQDKNIVFYFCLHRQKPVGSSNPLEAPSRGHRLLHYQTQMSRFLWLTHPSAIPSGRVE